MHVFHDLTTVQDAIRAEHARVNGLGGHWASTHGGPVLRAMEAAGIELIQHRVSYGGIVFRVQVTASGLPVCIDHYSGRGRKRGELTITVNDPGICYKPVQLENIGAWYLEDSYPSGKGFKDASRGVLYAFWQGGNIVQVYEHLGRALGHCAICGAGLTVAESIARGIGPECVRKPWVAAFYRKAQAAGVLIAEYRGQGRSGIACGRQRTPGRE